MKTYGLYETHLGGGRVLIRTSSNEMDLRTELTEMGERGETGEIRVIEDSSVDGEILALACLLDVDIRDIDELGGGEFEVGDGTYLVLTERGADEKAREYIEDVVDELMVGTPSLAHEYFDIDRFFSDEMVANGRGLCIAQYDGVELEVGVNGGDYYIYRIS